MPAHGQDGGSMLLVEEYFATEDARFLDTLRLARQPRALAALADRWKKDPRPWARQQLFAYLDQPLNCPGHQPVVKRWFKHAEETSDLEVMAAFLVAFDRHVRRRIRTKWVWDPQTRNRVEEDRLVTPRDVIPSKDARAYRNPATGDLMSAPSRMRSGAKLFRYRTRYYLRRRAWRFFRWLGHRQPDRYPTAIAAALRRYTDADLARGENILDSWGLLHACFHGHEALEFGATHVSLKEGRTLGELTPAPDFGESWKKPECTALLFALVTEASSRLARVWAMQLWQRDHAASALPLEQLLRLLDHDDAEVQQFGARLLQNAPGLATLAVEGWLRLLQTRNHDALQIVCDVFARQVAPDRLTLAQSLELACRQPVPVARLGQQLLKGRSFNTPADRSALVALANAYCPAVAGELATWALGIVGVAGLYQTDTALPFLDSLRRETREAAWNWVVASPQALADAVLWSRLTETPHDDLRLRLIDYLHRHERPGGEPLKLDEVWRSVLLGVHRGGRQKAKSVHQIAQALIDEPARAEVLLPVLAAAVRSVRGPESRAGLAAVLGAIQVRPELAPLAQRVLPELKVEAMA